MPWGAAAVVGAALITSNAAGDAADTQAAATNAANAQQQAQYDQTRADNMPALQARNASLARMQELLGIGGDTSASGYGSASKQLTAADVMAEPGYQFGLDQGTTALNRQAAANGSYNSGAALKAAARYGTDYATTKYDNAFNRLQTQNTNAFNQLASIAGTGQTAANLLGSAGSSTANAIGNNTTALGNATAASQLSSANGWTSAANQLGGWWNAPSSGSSISNGSLASANLSSDPIGSLATSQNWYSV